MTDKRRNKKKTQKL